jgi:predicted nuclease of predicted toxin-antitoxin system
VKGYLFDENLPRRLTITPSLSVTFSDSLGTSPSDTVVWNHARSNALAIVTKDSDFSHRIMQSSPPPWVVHLRFGNLRLKQFHDHLAKTWPQVERLLPDHKLVCVYIDRVEAFRD